MTIEPIPISIQKKRISATTKPNELFQLLNFRLLIPSTDVQKIK